MLPDTKKDIKILLFFNFILCKDRKKVKKVFRKTKILFMHFRK